MSPSSQSMESSGVAVHPTGSAHESRVHGLPSSHATVRPEHVPLAQRSELVQTRPSSQGAPSRGVKRHEPELQESDVQALPTSKRAFGEPCRSEPDSSRESRALIAVAAPGVPSG